MILGLRKVFMIEGEPPLSTPTEIAVLPCYLRHVALKFARVKNLIHREDDMGARALELYSVAGAEHGRPRVYPTRTQAVSRWT